jgi:hypothetical protein
MLAVSVRTTAVVLFNVYVMADQDRCAHAGRPLSKGPLEAGVLANGSSTPAAARPEPGQRLVGTLRGSGATAT